MVARPVTLSRTPQQQPLIRVKLPFPRLFGETHHFIHDSSLDRENSNLIRLRPATNDTHTNVSCHIRGRERRGKVGDVVCRRREGEVEKNVSDGNPLMKTSDIVAAKEWQYLKARILCITMPRIGKNRAAKVHGMIMKRPESCSDDCDDPKKIKRSEMERQKI
jgi:hypothetical protein